MSQNGRYCERSNNLYVGDRNPLGTQEPQVRKVSSSYKQVEVALGPQMGQMTELSIPSFSGLRYR